MVKDGAYSISRNPIYLFYDLYFFGTFLISGTAVFLILTICLFITLHYLILEEERVLAIRHGQDYQEYRSRTGRYFTFRKVEVYPVKRPS